MGLFLCPWLGDLTPLLHKENKLRRPFFFFLEDVRTLELAIKIKLVVWSESLKKRHLDFIKFAIGDCIYMHNYFFNFDEIDSIQATEES